MLPTGHPGWKDLSVGRTDSRKGICGAGTEVEMMTKKESLLFPVVYSAAITQRGPAGRQPPGRQLFPWQLLSPTDPLLNSQAG